MPRIICCDDVFDVLTRGPFPAGTPEDADVEVHLRGCHECRQLAEALRPAVGLFHESLREGSLLPSYQGRLPATPMLDRQLPSKSLIIPALMHAVRIAAAIMLITAACLTVLWLRSAGSGSERMSAQALPPARGAQLLANLKLPASCLPKLESAVADCCTLCHAAALATSAPATAAPALAQSCQACH